MAKAKDIVNEPGKTKAPAKKRAAAKKTAKKVEKKKTLVIVESPAKVKTIGKFLGKDFLVEASVGHVRDLPVRDLGVDEAQGFAPRYQVIKGKEEVVKRLKAAAKKAGHVFLAPDPDREGEAIAWHVAELIKDDNRNLSRIQFNEITPRAVREIGRAHV